MRLDGNDRSGYRLEGSVILGLRSIKLVLKLKGSDIPWSRLERHDRPGFWLKV